MLIATDWSAEDRKVPPDLIKSAVPVSGLYDLEPLLAHSVNDDLRLTPEVAHRLSPVGMKPRTSAPVAIYVGAAESDEFRRQSRLLAQAWDPYSPALSLRELPGHDHFTILRDLADPDYVVQRRIRALMGLG
jgi:arylformamidase